MNVIFMTGSHPRHLFIAHKLKEAGFLQGLIIEEREKFMPTPPDYLLGIDRENFIRHFSDRDICEQKFFGRTFALDLFDRVPVLQVKSDELNSQKVIKWIQTQKPDQLISYGVHKLSQEVIESCANNAWNIHGGLSPWYRGNITLFWPFYFMRPNWAGMTIHKLSSSLDAGDIIHHVVPELKKGDGIHDVACRAVAQAADDLVKILSLRKAGHQFDGVPQTSGGKLFTSSDWDPQHLRVIYQLFQNDIVDQFLQGNIKSDPPPLIKAF